MRRLSADRFPVFSGLFAILLLWTTGSVFGQETPAADFEIRAVPRVLGQDRQVVWEQPLVKQTQAGKPMLVKIESENMQIKVAISAYGNASSIFLVVQSDLAMRQDARTTGRSSVQSLSCKPGEKLLFFPLGNRNGPSSHQIVVEITVTSLHD